MSEYGNISDFAQMFGVHPDIASRMLWNLTAASKVRAYKFGKYPRWRFAEVREAVEGAG